MKRMMRFLALACAVLGLGAAHAGTPIRDQYIVVLDATKVTAPVAQLAQSLLGFVGGGELLFVYERSVPGFATRLPAVAAEALALLPIVKYVEQDQTMSLVATQANPPWGLDRIDQANLPLDQAYTYPAGAGSGAHVYVIDTGLRSTHVDFAGRVGNGRNFASNGGGLLCQLLGINCPAPNPSDTNDCNGHGTHVSGTAAGTTYGVAKSAIVHPVRVFGCGNSTATSTIIAGVEWTTANRVAGRSVANMSLGGGASQALDDAVRGLIASGVTVAIAAGNNSANACNESPGRVPEGITVGSTTIADARSSFSNFGSCVDLFAPGSDIVSAGIANDMATSTLSGTSMASPHTAGAAARYIGANPGVSPATVQSALVSAATPNVISNPGAGSPNRLLFVNPAGP